MAASSSNFGAISNCTTAQIAVLEQRMRPGSYSTAGFLANNENLVPVYQRDLEVLKERGISCQQIGDLLAHLIDKATPLANSCNGGVVRIGKFDISGADVRTVGYQPCPFGDEAGSCKQGRGDFEITNIENGKVLKCSELAIHLIQQHQFFEGATPYRVDPLLACTVLELTACQYQRNVEPKWDLMICESLDEAAETLGDFAIYKNHAREVIVISPTATAYIVPCAGIEQLKAIDKAGRPSKICKTEYMESAVELYCHVVCTQKDEMGRDEYGCFVIMNQQKFDQNIADRRLRATLASGVYIYKMGEMPKVSMPDSDEKE